MAMIKLEEVEVGAGGAASITFDNINQTGQDLVLFGKLRSTDGNTSVNLICNPDETPSYNTYFLQSFRATETSGRTISVPGKAAHSTESTAPAENFGAWQATLVNYVSDTVYLLSDYGSAEGSYATIGNAAQLHTNYTSPGVEKITIYPVTGFAEGTKLSLYMTKE